MLTRDVLINGKVWATHEVMTIEHNYDSNATFVGVVSRTDEEPPTDTITYHQHDLDESLTRAQAEAWIGTLPFFEEYVSEADGWLSTIADMLTDEQAITVVQIYPSWKPGASYAQGSRVQYMGGLYKCLQAHESTESWNPVDAPSIWAALLTVDDEVLDWVQPDSTNPYMTGDKVRHNGSTWISIVDNNVWEPGVYGWDEA